MKRVVSIQDISCLGKCSLTVALPIISAMGVETCVVPTAVLSTHTGGFQNFTFHDLTGEIAPIAAHWKSQNIAFDAIYTGYLGSFEQIDLVGKFFDDFGGGDTLVYVDPAMADHGVLYAGFAPDFPSQMARLVDGADYILPNLTEAALLVGEKPKLSGYTKDELESLIAKLHALGAKNVVLTGVSFSPDELGSAVSDGSTVQYDFNPKLEKMSHGTGDVYASVFAGAVLRGKTALEAAALAADVVCEAIKATDDDHWYGVSFERAIPFLAQQLA